MLKAEYIVYLGIYINISFKFVKATANQSPNIWSAI